MKDEASNLGESFSSGQDEHLSFPLSILAWCSNLCSKTTSPAEGQTPRSLDVSSVPTNERPPDATHRLEQPGQTVQTEVEESGEVIESHDEEASQALESHVEEADQGPDSHVEETGEVIGSQAEECQVDVTETSEDSVTTLVESVKDNFKSSQQTEKNSETSPSD